MPSRVKYSDQIMVSKLFYAEDWKLPFSCFVNSIYFCVSRKFLLETAGVKELVLNFYSYKYVDSNAPSIFTVAGTVRVYRKMIYFYLYQVMARSFYLHSTYFNLF